MEAIQRELAATRERLSALEAQAGVSVPILDLKSRVEAALLAAFQISPLNASPHVDPLSPVTSVPSAAFADECGFPHDVVVGVLKSLEVDRMLRSEGTTVQRYEVTEEARGYVVKGSPEMQCFLKIAAAPGGLNKECVEEFVGKEIAALGLGKCLGNKWVTLDKATKVYTQVADTHPRDDLVEKLQSVELWPSLPASGGGGGSVTPLTPAAGPPADVVKDLKARKLIVLKPTTTFLIQRGEKWALTRVKPHADLTKELLDSGAWSAPGAAFRAYNFETAGREVGGGCVHALMRVRAEFRQILLEMGFSEMPTNRWVESSFWNFDALFQPQSHPARDAHDTFFLTEPAATRAVPEGLLASVQAMHEGGGSGSLGYRYAWKRSEAEKNLLRTHTTAISARMLHALATAPGGFKPAKLFSIDRVFRNEALDATHLAEFHQVEGVVADAGLSLGDLIGVITEFFRRIGITELRFKPAYNPYTEPSMEVFGYHPDLKKWTEIGNSGIFRPEMLAPLGLPPNVRVIAWGLSLERPTMIKYRCKNIRELFGHKSQFGMSRGAPIARF